MNTTSFIQPEFGEFPKPEPVYQTRIPKETLTPEPATPKKESGFVQFWKDHKKAIIISTVILIILILVAIWYFNDTEKPTNQIKDHPPERLQPTPYPQQFYQPQASPAPQASAPQAYQAPASQASQAPKLDVLSKKEHDNIVASADDKEIEEYVNFDKEDTEDSFNNEEEEDTIESSEQDK